MSDAMNEIVAESGVTARRTHVASVRTYPFEIPFRAPPGATEHRAYRWGFGVTPSISGVFVRVETDTGLVGWGEASMIFHPRQPATILLEAIDSMAQSIAGANPFDRERIVARLYTSDGWHFLRDLANYAIGGIDMAMYDLIGRASGLSASDLLGGRVRDEVPFMYFLYWDELEASLAEARRAVADGFSCLYVKVGMDNPHEEIERIRSLRDAVGKDVQIRIDANERWSPGMAVRFIRQLEDLDLEFVEQPVLAQDVESLAMVRRRSRTPIAADQASRTTHQVLRIIRAEAADIVSSDPGSAGGMTAARKAAAIAETAGLPFIVHSNVEAGIGTAAAVHLGAACVNCSYANQTEYQFASADILTERLRIEQGAIRVPDEPGLGVDVDEDAVEQLAEAFHHSLGGKVQAESESWYVPNY